MTPKYLIFFTAVAFVGGSVAQVYKANVPSEVPQEIPETVEPEVQQPKNEFITQTVYGFLDFTTTIGNTVMVFSPQSAPPEGSNNKVEKSSSSSTIETKPTAPQKKIPNIQASKTQKSEQQHQETKKQVSNKGTKVIVNSIVAEQTSQNDLASPTKIEKPKNHDSEQATTKSSMSLSSVVQVVGQSDVPGVKNNLAEPEYDFLSKQPTEVIDETYKLINLRPSSKPVSKPHRPSPKKEKENPTGLVTRLGGTIVKDGLTTVHETSVIGTYINGKYAQVLQSTSRIVKNAGTPAIPEGKIRPSNAQRILKTIGPQHGKLKPQLEPTPTHQQEESSLPLEDLFSAPPGPVRTTRRHTGSHPPRPKFRNNKIIDDIESNETSQQPPARNVVSKNRPASSRPSYKNRQITTTTEGAPTTRRRSGFRPSNNQPSLPPRSVKNRLEPASQSTLPVPKVKLPRTQGRWSYKTTPKPRIAIRKQVEDDDRLPLTPDPLKGSETSSPIPSNVPSEDKNNLSTPASQRKIQEGVFDDELDPSETEEVSVVQEQQIQQQQADKQQQQPQQQQQQQQQTAPVVVENTLPIETLNVEISTSADFDDIYFEIATIKSPYTFQVGTMKNTRYVTVTSTIKKSFATAEVPNPGSTVSPTEPLTENILVNTGRAYESSLPLDSSIATLPAITLESGQATPPLETMTETFSTTQTLLKTHMLPIVSAGNTTRITLVQTYNIARIVTATKTLPPMEIYQFVPSKTLNEFNSKLDEAGSELHLELDFGDDERDDEDIPKRIVAPNSTDQTENTDLDVFRHQASPQKPKVEQAPIPSEPQLTPEQIQQLALLKYFGAAPQPQPQVVTTSRPVIVLETVYESHVIPLVNSGNTIYSTLSRPIATVPRTSYEYGTSTIAPIIPQQPLSPALPPGLFPQAPQQHHHQPQFTVTSAPHVTQTLATVSESRILKLTFGAKTAYTTLFSTRVVPTEITTYVTSTIPLQQTVQAYPGYYPPPVPYPPFPYVG